MRQAAYLRVAAEIRDDIEAGELPPGTQLDDSKTIAQKHGISQETALKALRHLAAEGYVTIPPRSQAVVRQRPNTRIVVRDRNAYRDEIGYFFDQNAKDWRAVTAPTRKLEVPPNHIADLLGVERGEDVVVRDRGMGPDGSKRAFQIATSYISMALATEIPALRAERAGPGGIYDRIEEHFQAPIQWRETISSRLPDLEEQSRLGIPPTVPLLVVTRESRILRGEEEVIAEVNETRMAAEQFAVSYTVERDDSAAWPREERAAS
ncbi:GntR family transcriptional regulator [Streptomyces sp. NPDC059786]|uniref:GntR family transcriptional regulator n=1 Tax=Streptomyces sp. NPDC059786 TaxID=3346946 RepID=UPI0036585347